MASVPPRTATEPLPLFRIADQIRPRSDRHNRARIISDAEGFNQDDLYVDLRSIFGYSLFLKCEGFNFAGSIKLKAAAEMVEAAERDGTLKPGSILIESLSGNLGVALSMIAARRATGSSASPTHDAICRPGG